MTLVETFQKYRTIITSILPTEPNAAMRPPAEAREVYAPLGAYHLAMQFKRKYEETSAKEFGEMDEQMRQSADRLQEESDFKTLSATTAWTALLLYAAGKLIVRDASTDLASDFFGRLSRSQSESGRFYPANNSASPESAWFEELATLHAAASYAVQAEDRTVAKAVARSTEFISREIEPDHATGQPWGLFAFIWNEQTRPLADQLLHAVEMRKNELDSVSLILLQDALYCVELFL